MQLSHPGKQSDYWLRWRAVSFLTLLRFEKFGFLSSPRLLPPFATSLMNQSKNRQTEEGRFFKMKCDSVWWSSWTNKQKKQVEFSKWNGTACGRFQDGFGFFVIHWGCSRTIICKEGQRNLFHMLLLEMQKVSSEAGGCQPEMDSHLKTRPLLFFF